MFVEAGCKEVRTYIQSGNVIFNASPSVYSRVSDRITAQIAKQLGYRTPVILRTSAELQDVLVGNPFLTPGVDEKALYVMFLANTPAPADVAKLDPDRSPGDAFIVRGQAVYMHLPKNVAASQAHQCLLRLEARHDQYQPELADGHEAAGVDGGESVAFSRKLRELRIRLIE